MGASITLAGADLIAQKHITQEGLDVVQFIFANVPGLDHSGPVDRAAGMPDAGQIVYTATIPAENKGYVNPHQVVYSVQVGSDVGDWDFNWIGLKTAEGVLFAVSYVPLQQKRRNIPPLQLGNNLTRNFLVVFDGAQALTGVTIDASTWQHDFTVRLAGIDERERQSNRDIFGRACFFGSALQLEKVGAVYQLKPGTAYVEGVRLQRAAALPVVPPIFPTTAWLDVALQRELNDVVASWSVVWGAGKVDYVDSVGVQHYCVAIADLPNSNTITDSRPVENITGPLVAHFQPKDQTLTALASLVTAEDMMIFATGSDEFSTATLTAKARTLLASANEENMRSFLGLTSAAITAIVNSATDITEGRLLTTGYCGLGGVLIATDMNTVAAQPTGFYSTVAGTTTFTPPAGLDANGIIWNQVRAAAGPSAQAAQLWVHQSTGRMFRRSAFANVWTAFKEDWNSANLTPAELSPPGAVVHFARNTVPNGWLKANGAAVSRATYAALFTAIGTTFGSGNGSTTFNLPDLRGEFVRGWDDGRGVDSARAFGSTQDSQNRAHTHKYGKTHDLSYGLSATGIVGANPTAQELYDTASSGGTEARPRNVALLACIKY